MKPILSLNFGYNDAENYKKSGNKQFFNKIFVKNEFLDQLLDDDKYFLIGEKGTGKTAYAVFLTNNNYKETISSLKYIRETDYAKFIALKQSKHLQLSDYTSIWKVILLLLISSGITEREIATSIFAKHKRIQAIRQAIDEYYASAFDPEIISALQIIEDSKVAAELLSKYLKASGEKGTTISFNHSTFQVNLMYIEKQFKDTLKAIKLVRDHLLFIDGIDVRPGSIPYTDYLECIKGLANAAWELNSDYFSQIKDSKGRMKVVVLIRPDIFNSLNLQNSTNKLLDNSVFLDWRTTYPTYRTSKLFQVADSILRVQQDNYRNLSLGEAWDYYLPWKSRSTNPMREHDDSFIDLLRISYSRPRDIITILILLQKQHKDFHYNYNFFRKKDIFNDVFQNQYSQYLMGSIRDQLSFYYTNEEYETFLAFFQFLNGKAQFSYKVYLNAYEKFIDYILEKRNSIPEFVETDEKFLQFLYDTNVICFIEKTELEPLFRWCYRERSISNISPKVRLGVEYRVHKGLLKELNLGFMEMKSKI